MSAGGYQLAQLNVGRLVAPIDHPTIKGFVENLDRINALAETQDGFVWRLVGEGDNATDLRPFPDPDMAVKLSVWTGLEPLAAFVYRTAHREVMRRRREWFFPMETYMALWWVRRGHNPKPAEAWDRLQHLAEFGPSARAFTFKHPFPAPDALAAEPSILDQCA